MKVEIEELGACKRRLQVEEAPRGRPAGLGAGLRPRAEARRSCPASARARCRASMIKLHFADDVRQEVARHLIPDVYRQALAGDAARAGGGARSAGGHARGGRAAQVRRGGGDQARHRARRSTPGSSVAARAQAVRRSRGGRGARARCRSSTPSSATVERPADVGDLVIMDYTLTPEGRSRAPRRATASSSAAAAVLPEMDEAVIGLDRGRRAPDARCASPTTTATRRCAASRREASVTVTEVKEKVLPAARRRARQGRGRSSRRWTRSGRGPRPGSRRDASGEPPRAGGRGRSTRSLAGAHVRGARERSCCARWGTRSSTPASACAGRAWTRTRCRGTTRSCWRSCGRAPRRRCARALLLEAIAEKEGLAAGRRGRGRRGRARSPRPASGRRPAVRRHARAGRRPGGAAALPRASAKTLDFLIETKSRRRRA